MRQLIAGFVLLFCFSAGYGQPPINRALKNELDSIYTLDQKYRELMYSDLIRNKADSIADSYKIPRASLFEYLITTMNRTDSSNLVRIEQLFKQYGYPGKSLVGTPTNEAAFFVIQHSQSIDRYLDVLKKAAEKNELDFKLYAMMLDRSLMYNGKEQLYGTQGKGMQITNTQTGQKSMKMIIWPVKDPAMVNKRRKEAGFKDTVEENATRLGIVYEVLTLDDVKKMQ